MPKPNPDPNPNAAASLRDLADRARSGDREALSELIRLHRSRMLTWANRVTRRPASAEDVVQDALVSVLKRIDRLSDPDKFVPWLRAIVRNQALMAVRGRRAGRETPLGDPDSASALRADGRLAASAADDPQHAAVARLGLETVDALLGRLGERERQVVRAHGLSGLSIRETAGLLGMRTGAVHTALSRARVKLAEARFEDELVRFVDARRRSGKPRRTLLSRVRYLGYAGAYQTLASTIVLTAVAAGRDKLGLTEAMGATGLAFRLQAAADFGISGGAYAFDWAAAARDGLRGAGLSCAVFGGAGRRMTQPDELIETIEAVYDGLERGVPAIAWNVANAEFGLVVGFDDDDRSWIVLDTSTAGRRLPYVRLGRPRADAEWFVAVPQRLLTERDEGAPGRMLRQAAAHMLAPAAGAGVAADAVPGALGGQDAYRRWMRAFADRSATDALSVAYQAAVAAEARAHAARLLDRCARSGKLRDRRPAAVPPIAHAARLQARIAEQWARIAGLFPLPFGADPSAPGPADRALQLLERSLALELEAAEAMRIAADALDR